MDVFDELIRDSVPQARWTEGEIFAASSGYVCRVKRSRFDRPEETEYISRDLYFRIFEVGQVICAGHFREWRALGITLYHDMFEAMDCLSFADSELASVILESWDEDDAPFLYGDVIEFRRLVVNDTLASAVPWDIFVRKIISRYFQRPGSVLLLKAFPLEYESRLPKDDDAAKRDFANRQRAMVRHYQRRLSMDLLPGEAGDRSWMWRRLRYCQPPKGARRK